MQSLQLVPSPDKPMTDTPVRYRIVHAEHPHWYWSVMGIWGLKADDARIFTARERDVEALPMSGLWEVVADRRPFDRSIVAQAIARLLWSQYRLEEGLPLQRIEDAPLEDARRFHEASKFVTNWTLSPDRAKTALMAMADVICSDGDGVLSIFDVSPRTQKHLYHLAVSALNALQQNVKDVPPDWHYRDQLCRTLDAIAPKETKPCAK